MYYIFQIYILKNLTFKYFNFFTENLYFKNLTFKYFHFFSDIHIQFCILQLESQVRLLNAIVTKIPHELDSRICFYSQQSEIHEPLVNRLRQRKERECKSTSQPERYKRAREVHLTGHKKEWEKGNKDAFSPNRPFRRRQQTVLPREGARGFGIGC